MYPLPFEEWVSARLRACIHSQAQPALPPTLFDDSIHFIDSRTDRNPVADRLAEERSQVKRQPVVTDTENYVVPVLQPERLVPHVFQHAARPGWSARSPLRTRGAGPGIARNLIERHPC